MLPAFVAVPAQGRAPAPAAAVAPEELVTALVPGSRLVIDHALYDAAAVPLPLPASGVQFVDGGPAQSRVSASPLDDVHPAWRSPTPGFWAFGLPVPERDLEEDSSPLALEAGQVTVRLRRPRDRRRRLTGGEALVSLAHFPGFAVAADMTYTGGGATVAEALVEVRDAADGSVIPAWVVRGGVLAPLPAFVAGIWWTYVLLERPPVGDAQLLGAVLPNTAVREAAVQFVLPACEAAGTWRAREALPRHAVLLRMRPPQPSRCTYRLVIDGWPSSLQAAWLRACTAQEAAS